MRLRTLGWVVLVVCTIAPVFNLLTSEASLGEALQGLVAGLIVALLAGGWMLFVRDGVLRARFRYCTAKAKARKNGSATSNDRPAVLEEYAKGHGLEARFLEELAPRGKERTIAIHSLAEASR
jgi:hypothetical protein